jgi:phytoene desaturase
MAKKAIIVGAGIAGLASAIRLANNGFIVDVIDQNSFVGGKLHSFEKDNFRFDFGPSLFTMPHLVEELFTLCGKHASDYFKYSKIDTTCHYFWNDRTQINAYADPDAFGQEIEKKLHVNSSVLAKYLNYSYNIYKHTAPFFLQKSLHQWQTFKNNKLFGAFLNIFKFDLFTTMHKANKKRLKHPKLVQIFDRFATYNGSNPYSAPGILNVIPSLENNWGAFFPAEGMVGITNALHVLAIELGVVFHLNETAESITYLDGKITGVKTNKQSYSADVVISNADMWFTYHRLLPNIKKPKKLLAQERSSSALVFYWGINGLFPQLDLHNIFFSNDYEKEFDALFNKLTITEDPTIYINITSKYRKEDAPANCENWFVMINVPRNNGQNWDELKKRARKSIIEKLNTLLSINLNDLIVSETITDPIVIEEKTGSFAGSLYGTSSNNKLAAFLRQKNNGPLEGLYFCGGSVHPGGGIPLCLWSAQIATDMIKEKYT